MKQADLNCPVCDTVMRKADLPQKYSIYSCEGCGELGQVVDGAVAPLGSLLERNALGDDRVRAAVSAPHVSTVASFIEIFENSTRFWQMDQAAASGGLRTILAQIENRVDFAIAKFTGLDMASDEAAEGLRMLREARELVSTLPSRSRGVKEEEEVPNEHGEIRSQRSESPAGAGAPDGEGASGEASDIP